MPDNRWTVRNFYGVSAPLLGISLFAVVLISAAGWPNRLSADPVPDPRTRFRVYADKYCVPCHGPQKPASGLRLDNISFDFASAVQKQRWAEVVRALNLHQMPPATAPQPPGNASAVEAEWIESKLGKAEAARRDTHTVLRRLNRAEYNNTIRDLFGLDVHPADKFPEDGAAGGFDNNGTALTVSPMHLEMYYNAARQVLDLALPQGPAPQQIKWHFEPEENTLGGDRYRVKRDGQSILLNCGNNPIENGFTVIHHDSWDKGIDFRTFTVPAEGDYIIRFRAASRVPGRDAVVQSAEKILKKRFDSQMAENSKGEKYYRDALNNDLEHFKTHRMYSYGPPRVKVTLNLAGAPILLTERDVDAPVTAPAIYEVKSHFTQQEAGVELHYAYEIPHTLENFWFQGRDEFARPELLIDWVEVEGPITPQWPPASYRAILGSDPLPTTPEQEKVAARRILTKFLPRAYRRPVSPAEVDSKLALFSKFRADKPDFIEAIKVPLAAALTSPDFLFLTEPAVENGGTLGTYPLASRLSYFLWSSMPDEELMRHAASGDLKKPEVLIKQADRMLKDPKSAAFVKNFCGQWLGLRKVGANPPVQNLYPEYDRHLEVSQVLETEGFFAEILHNDLDARSLIKSEFVTINERLARFYGIPGVHGDAIRRVPVSPEMHRGGLVTQASILSITSNGTRTSPVSRGVWVLRTLLGQDPGLPVANVGEIASKVPGIDKATVRQRLQIHRQNPSCARCHDKIDPLGFALENYNACGEWRDQEGHGYNGRIERDDPKIDAASLMPDGTPINGVQGLQEQLLKQQDRFFTVLASQLTSYAVGREVSFGDKPAIQHDVAAMQHNGHTLRALVHAIIVSPPFLNK
jgi:Protein of unknown function (DUF1592)/Protein of unknown function (DUF1588)/Protein of unknown function (DUF1587)/Protein of unknown function (DUF1595)/Protein of unknown function (DUF1585)/Planctomycete cytochrome C